MHDERHEGLSERIGNQRGGGLRTAVFLLAADQDTIKHTPMHASQYIACVGSIRHRSFVYISTVALHTTSLKRRENLWPLSSTTVRPGVWTKSNSPTETTQPLDGNLVAAVRRIN